MNQESSSFREELTLLISRYKKNADSNTPAFILAQYLQQCLLAWDVAVSAREKWYGKVDSK